MEIRAGEHKDLVSILEINAEFDYDNPDEFISEHIDKGRVIVALVDGKVVGFLLYQKIWGNLPFLALVKVTKSFQRKGLGVGLVSSFEKQIHGEGYESYISSTELKNINSQNFHKRLRLSKIGELKLIDGEELFYEKRI